MTQNIFFNISKEELEKYYIQENKSAVQIAKIFSVCTSTVTTKLKKFLIPIRTASQRIKLAIKQYGNANAKICYINTSEEELRIFYEVEKLSLKEIGAKFNMSSYGAKILLQKHAIRVKYPGEFLKGTKRSQEIRLKTSKTMSGKKHLENCVDKIKCANPSCKNTFHRKPSHLSITEHNFCSQECHYQWKSDNI